MMEPTTWNDMFHLAVPLLEKIVRPILVYLFLVVSLRLAGKRELAQLNPFDLVVLLTLSNTVQNAIIGDDNSVTGGIIGATALLVTNFLVVRFLFGHPGLDRLVEGEAEVLIDRGRVMTARLQSELITVAELEAAARKQGFESLAEIERAVLDPGGAISFVGKKPSAETAQHREVMARLDLIHRELTALRAAPSA